MDARMLSVLNDAERQLVAQTDPAALAELDEDAVAELHDRVRRARGKYVSQYRRGAAQQVDATGARGKAYERNQTARTKAEVMERALAQVSRRLAVLARQSAAELRTERLAAAREQRGTPPGLAGGQPPVPAGRRSVTDRPRGDRDLVSPASRRQTAATRASGARSQARRDAGG